MARLNVFDHVECIDGTPDLAQSKVMPKQGEVYRVASVRGVDDLYSVRLFELTPECHIGGPCRCGDCGWDARRFRKVDAPAKEQISEQAQRKLNV